MMNDTMKKAFTLVEMLVVIAVISLLCALILPALGKARESAKNTVVNTELHQIALALECYGHDHKDKFPPTYVSCMTQEHYYQLPFELTRLNYLPGKPDVLGPMSSAFEDRYNPEHTYKYLAPGDLVINQGMRPLKNKSRIWIPDNFNTDSELDTGQFYRVPEESPVSWVIYSLGPNFDETNPDVLKLHYPVPQKTWYDSQRRRGFLTRIRLRDGVYTGTFQRNR